MTMIKKTMLCPVLLSAGLLACGVNPVTKEREFQFVSQDKEVQIGQQNYSPARQSQGGDYTLDTELTRYVQQVGQRLAAVSDRPDLPYEFVVLNDSVPNAWAMPGGKIAFNRGLLYELHSEAELAAVLGHEIVHAAARHGAKSMERGVFCKARCWPSAWQPVTPIIPTLWWVARSWVASSCPVSMAGMPSRSLTITA